MTAQKLSAKELKQKEKSLDQLEKSMQATIQKAEDLINSHNYGSSVFHGFNASEEDDEIRKTDLSEKKSTAVRQPFFQILYEFFKFIPEADDIVNNVVNSVLHKDFIIEPTGKGGTQKDKKLLEEFLEHPINNEIHAFLLKNHEVFGCAFAELGNTKGKDNPAGNKFGYMYPIITPRTQILVDKDLYLKGVAKPVGLQTKGTSNKVIPLTWDNVFHFKRNGLTDIVYGESAFEYNQPMFELVVKAIKKNIVKMEQSVSTNIAFEYEKDVPFKEIQQNAKVLSSLYAGWKKSGKMMHLPGGVTLHELKDDINGLSYVDLIKLGREMVRTKYSYPQETDHAGSKTYVMYITNTVNPLKRKYTKAYNYYIVKRKLGINGWKVTLPEMKVGDSLDIAREGEIGVRNAGMTINEWRERNDLPKFEGEWADKPMVRTDRYIYDPVTGAMIEVNPKGDLENNPNSTSDSNTK